MGNMETQLFWMVGKDFFFSTHKLGRERNDTRIFLKKDPNTQTENARNRWAAATGRRARSDNTSRVFILRFPSRPGEPSPVSP
jgi:hypothetical protein